MNGNSARTAVVVGAGSRIGRAITLELARRGFRVGIAEYGEDDARGTLERVRREGGEAELYSCDVRDHRQVQAMANFFFDSLGGVSLLVNNPGLDDCGRPAGGIPACEWEEVIDTNLLGVVHACQAFLPRMMERGGGHIANGTYGAGIVPAADHLPYDIARAGVISYTEKLKAELAPCDIAISMLYPALIDTRLIDGWLKRAGFDVASQ